MTTAATPVPGTPAHACAVDDALARAHPDACCELDHGSPFELLVATVLSAQTTDVRVNAVTPEVFRRWPSPRELAGAEREELEDVLRPLGFFRAKAKSLHGLCAGLLDEGYEGADVPRTLEELTALPGVGRKTANVVLGNAFDIPGITVDTHVGRLARRLGMTTAMDPVRVEKDLAALWEPERWVMACHRLIFHGRRVCTARRPVCGECPIAALCPRIGV